MVSSYAAALLTGMSTRYVIDASSFERVCRTSPVEVAAVSLSDLELVRGCAAVAAAHRIPWIGLGATDPLGAETAYGLGSIAALPPSMGGVTTLRRLLADLTGSQVVEASEPDDLRPVRMQASRRGETIALAEDEILTVHHGVFASIALYPDGMEVMLGIHPAGEVIVGSPQLADWAQRVTGLTAGQTSTRRRTDAAASPELLSRVIVAGQASTAWSAAQVRTPIDRRLLAILYEIARRLGHRAGERMMIDAGLTTADLARAIGTSRATVVRNLALLRRRGELTSTAAGSTRRWVLPGAGVHSPPDARPRAGTRR